jgi:hypothetical protein
VPFKPVGLIGELDPATQVSAHKGDSCDCSMRAFLDHPFSDMIQNRNFKPSFLIDLPYKGIFESLTILNSAAREVQYAVLLDKNERPVFIPDNAVKDVRIVSKPYRRSVSLRLHGIK